MYGEELNLLERSLFRAVAGGREAPSRPVKFAWVIAGRRSGKTAISSAIGFIRGAFLANPMLAALVEREGEFSLELNTGLEILVLANNYRSIRGRSILVAILDETGTGKDIIDHPRGEHDDLANGCCGVLTAAAARNPLRSMPGFSRARRTSLIPGADRVTGITVIGSRRFG
jgi:hypothetical protein